MPRATRREEGLRTWLDPVAIALLIFGGFAFLVSISLQPAGDKEPDEIVPSPEHQPPVTEPSVSVPEQPQEVGPSADLNALRARCVEETRSGKAMTQDPRSACQQFAIESRRDLPAARVPPPMPSLAQPPTRERATSDESLLFVPIQLADCEGRYGYGTIRYRDCRAQEAERLRRGCLVNGQKADQARGDLRQQLRTLARSYCREANRYRVID